MSISGGLNIMKPPGMTSHDVISVVRRILKEKRIGHAGTLDPAAAGVLPVCVGEATKAVQFLQDGMKVYRAELVLGFETDTEDYTGKILSEASEDFRIEFRELEQAIKAFVGTIKQRPPMVSAVKVDGHRLYELARKGITVERSERNVDISDIKVVMRPGSTPSGTLHKGDSVVLDVTCGKGTYIRTLCADIGKSLGCGAYMGFLLRMKVGEMSIDGSISLEELSELSLTSLHTVLVSLNQLIPLPALELKQETYALVRNGMTIKADPPRVDMKDGDLCKLMYSGDTIAVYAVSTGISGKLLKPVRVFNGMG